MSSGTITIKKDSLWKYSTFILGALVIVLLIVMMNKDGTTVVDNEMPSTPIAGQISASVDDDPFLGEDNAEVVIIEFSDYDCPFCKRHHDQTIPSLKSEYIETGKVKYVFRDFTPTLVNPSYHPNAILAAMAAECAREEGGEESYWQMHDAVFANQGQNTAANLKRIADGFGYDIADCLDGEDKKAEVQKDFNDGQQYGIQGTPGFLIGSNGKYRVLSGACPYAAFKQAIDAELAGKTWSGSNCQITVQ